MIRRAIRRLYARRLRRDVAFYTPWIGSMVSSREALPPGGAETQILMLSKALAARGLDVGLIVFGTPEEMPPSVGDAALVVRPPYRKRRRVVEKVVEVTYIWRALWEARARTVVVRGGGAVVGLVGAYAWLTGTRFVFSTAHVVDFDYKTMTPKARDLFLHTLGVRLADEIVVQTEEQLALSESAFGRPGVLIKSISRVVDRPTGAPEAFLWVGRLVSYKRPLEYLELARALPEARFWMVGVPTPHHDADRELIATVFAEAPKIDNLELLPPRPHAEVEELMGRAVASVNTAEFEGMPNVLLEAWCRGVPALVLSHDPGGVVAEYGLGGFAEGSTERLLELARELWRTRNERDQLSERCQRYIAEHHGSEAVARLWSEVLAGRPTARRIAAEHDGPGALSLTTLTGVQAEKAWRQ